MKKYFSLGVVLLSLLISGTVRAAENDAEASFRSSLKDFESAWKKDAKSVASYFAPNATLISPIGQEAKGRTDIEKVITADMANIVHGGTMHFELLSLRSLSPYTVFVDLENDITGRKGDGGVALDPIHLHVAGVATKKSGTWVWLDARPYAFLPSPSAAASPSPSASGSSVPSPSPAK